MRFIKLKPIIITIIAVAIIVGTVVYYLPLPFVSVNTQTSIAITHTALGTKNGVALMNSQNYNDITATQKEEIVSLFEKYNYHRRWNTLFSDGSLSDLGSDLIWLNLYDENTHSTFISISSSGGITIADKTYGMSNSQELINHLLVILNHAK